MAECIANEDGERQIACAVAFQGEEMVSPITCHQVVGVLDDPDMARKWLEMRGSSATVVMQFLPYAMQNLRGLNGNKCTLHDLFAAFCFDIMLL